MNPLDQLLRDAMTEHTDTVPHLRPGSARRALITARRRRTASMAAAGTATLAATAGVGAFVVSHQPATSTSGSFGGLGGGRAAVGHEPRVARTTVAGKAAATVAPKAAEAPASAQPSMIVASAPKPGGEAPQALSSVSMADHVPGSTLTLSGSEVMYESRSPADDVWTKYFWFSKNGSSDHDVVVMVVDGADQPSWNRAQSPTPTISPMQVAGHAARNWLSGGDHYLYFTAGQFTVEVFGDPSTSADEMRTLGEAVQGLPQ